MQEHTLEYRYGQKTRQRAYLWLGLSSLLFVGLLVVLIGRWAEAELLTKGFAGVLLIALLFTIRAQLARITYRCRILPEQLQVIALFNNRSIPWANITEVRRMILPQLGSQRPWACTVLTHSRHDTAIPTFLFDHQLEHAEDALREIVRYTPHARHTNV
jgi:hypothetical protein